MRPLHLREWPLFHALWELGHGTPSDLLEALAEERAADLHTVRAMLESFVTEGYARSERSHGVGEAGDRLEIVTFIPVATPEDALRTAWPQLRELMLDDGRYLDLFRQIVGEGD